MGLHLHICRDIRRELKWLTKSGGESGGISARGVERRCVGYAPLKIFLKFVSQSKFQERKLEIIACLCKLLLCKDKTQAPDNPYATVMQKLENVLAILLFIQKKEEEEEVHFIHLKPFFPLFFECIYLLIFMIHKLYTFSP